MSRVRYIIGDTRAVVATIPDGSIDLVVTSPPFLALRSYLPADHPDKALEIGQEANPAAFLDVLLELTAEWGRVLAPHGSIAVELGDTYSGSGGGGGDYLPGGLREGQQKFAGPAATMRESNAAHWRLKNQDKTAWPLPKSLALIPELYRVALAYGVNPLTGTPSPAGRWRVRNVVRWCRPNPPVGALGDKYRPSTSDMVVACRSDKRWFDLDAVRDGERTSERPERPHPKSTAFRDDGVNGLGADTTYHARGGAPPLDHWIIPTQPYHGSHYATFPPKLVTVPIESMCPREVCTACGEPRRRIVGEAEYVNSRTGKAVTTLHLREGQHIEGQGNAVNSDGLGDRAATRVAPTLGWTDCGCGAPWRPGTVLDPFGGSGTVGAVASGMGRDAILIDIDERNADLARERVGMFLEVDG